MSIDVQALGWDPATVGELDHRRLRAPSIKLRAFRAGPGGDVVYSIDLRLRQPNTGQAFQAAELHSLEHFLLEGFQRLLPAHFVSVGVMGCRTGFYLVLLNEGRYRVVDDALAAILRGVIEAHAVPYARIDQCGHYRDHDLVGARATAAEMLACRSGWSRVL
jgi:S-ribosylhomocysteine lyase